MSFNSIKVAYRLLFLLLFFSINLQAKEKLPVEVKIEPTKTRYFLSEPVMVKVTITNNGEYNLKFGYHDLVERAEIKLNFDKADLHKVVILKKELSNGGMSAIENIKPNTKFTFEFLLNEFVEFKIEGVFKFSINFHFEYEVDKNINQNESSMLKVEQNLEIEIIKNDLVLLEKIYSDLYKVTLKSKIDENPATDERYLSSKKLCSVNNKLVLKYLALMSESKYDGVVLDVVVGLEKFGKDAKLALEKIIANNTVENYIKLKAEKMLKKLE